MPSLPARLCRRKYRINSSVYTTHGTGGSIEIEIYTNYSRHTCERTTYSRMENNAAH